jgi:hypothetical protein
VDAHREHVGCDFCGLAVCQEVSVSVAAIIPEKLPLLGLDGITLKSGNHRAREKGVCVMEAVAWIAGEPHSDHPQCACPVITSFMIRWNDRLPSDAERDRLLKPLIPLVVGTRSTSAVEKQRAELIFDFVARHAAPAALSLAGLDAAAEMLRANPTLENIRKARDQAWEARAAAVERARKKFVDAGVDAVVAAGVDAVVDAVVAAGVDAVVAAVVDAVVAAVVDAVVAAGVDAVVDWNKLDYWQSKAKAKEIALPIFENKIAPLKAALELSAQDLVRKMCALKEVA